MESYYFLFGLASVYTIFASIQDLRKREVANWLNFSLVAIALFYRGAYSIINNDAMFFVYGLAGLAIFFLLANLFYYGKVFAGGDAKLMIGFGVILPYQNLYDLIFVPIGFIIVLFVLGAIYSILFSTALAYKNREMFRKKFKEILRKKRWIVFMSIALCLLMVIEIAIIKIQDNIFFYGIFVIFFMPFLYIYLLAIEKSSMIVLTKPGNLTEGDWIENDISVGGRVIKKTVHGLDVKDILLLRKYNKSIMVKQGVPFVPAFLFALMFMVFFYLVLRLDFQQVFFYLF